MSYAGERLIHDADSHLMELDDCLDPYFEARLLRRYRDLPYLHRKNGDVLGLLCRRYDFFPKRSGTAI